jgi:hypothetical protein
MPELKLINLIFLTVFQFIIVVNTSLAISNLLFCFQLKMRSYNVTELQQLIASNRKEGQADIDFSNRLSAYFID